MQTVLNKVVIALHEFYAHEAFLLEKEAGERALTHRLAVHFEKQFAGWEIDCEYDRLGDRTLRLPHGSIVSTDDHLAKSIYPDIVVHQRAIPNNLLAVETRKSANHQPLEHDRHKLRALTDPHLWFAYWIGVLLTLGRTQVTASEVYTSGALDQALSGWFAGRLKDAGLTQDEACERRFLMTLTRSILAIALVALAQHALVREVGAQTAPAPDLEAILANAKIVKTLDDIKADDERAFAEQKRITETPAPPFNEKVRAEYYQKRMQELGFKDASIDAEGNVIALRKGTGGGRPKLVVSAHLDTVFPEGTDVTIKEKDGAIVAPGIGDDSRGLAAMLSLIKAMNENQIATVGDIMFVGTVGEEELGNLRGVKALFRDHTDIDGFISIDGLGITRVVNQATGSHRYEFTFKGPGGHSFQEFGLPSAIHAMGRAIAKISELQTPSDPRTTFTVGTVTGGTSVNAIAAEARMAVDMRSNSTEELLKLEARLLDLVKEAVADENARWKSDKMTVEARLIGNRPAGIVAMDSPIVQATQRAVAAVTRGPRPTFAGSSTDSNMAMSLGIPAVTIGGGGEGGNWHSRNEWYKPVNAWYGPQNALLTVLILTGLDGVTKPALIERKATK